MRDTNSFSSEIYVLSSFQNQEPTESGAMHKIIINISQQQHTISRS
jgi:hypothetical protein